MATPQVVSRSEHAVCITGMHRSGTSLTARALYLLGVSLGAFDRLMVPGSDNPAGYWENRDVKELNDEIFARLGGAWDVPPVLEPGWELDPSLDALRSRASVVLDAAFGASPLEGGIVGWKDPRLSLLLPFWRTVTPISATVVVVRHPLEVAESLRVRNGIDVRQSMVLWLRYLFAAARNDPDHLLVRDRDFFVDLAGTLSTLAAHVGLPPPTEAAIDEAHSYLDPSLRHHVATDAEYEDAGPLVAMASAVWNGGSVDLGKLPTVVTEAIACGWLRASMDAELLARARAEVVTLRDQIRKRRRQEREAQQATQGDARQSAQSSPLSVGERSNTVEDGDR
jgi:hypothetical protein